MLVNREPVFQGLIFGILLYFCVPFQEISKIVALLQNYVIYFQYILTKF